MQVRGRIPARKARSVYPLSPSWEGPLRAAAPVGVRQRVATSINPSHLAATPGEC